MLPRFTSAGAPSAQVPGGRGARSWLQSAFPAPMATTDTLTQPDGFPIAARGMAHSTPVVTPAPEAAPQPDPTPAPFELSMAARMPKGLVPPMSVPGAPVMV